MADGDRKSSQNLRQLGKTETHMGAAGTVQQPLVYAAKDRQEGLNGSKS
jgi:hypothetical protein